MKQKKIDFSELLINNLNIIFSVITKLYIPAYNIYGWYWLYKIISSPQLNDNWENYVLWFFAMYAQFLFEIDFTNKKTDVRKYFNHHFSKSKQDD